MYNKKELEMLKRINKRNRKRKFINGFTLGVFAYQINVFVAIIIVRLSEAWKYPDMNFIFEFYYFAFIIFEIIGALIWLPFILITNDIYKEKGLRWCIVFLAVILLVSLIIFNFFIGGRN